MWQCIVRTSRLWTGTWRAAARASSRRCLCRPPPTACPSGSTRARRATSAAEASCRSNRCPDTSTAVFASGAVLELFLQKTSTVNLWGCFHQPPPSTPFPLRLISRPQGIGGRRRESRRTCVALRRPPRAFPCRGQRPTSPPTEPRPRRPTRRPSPAAQTRALSPLQRGRPPPLPSFAFRLVARCPPFG